jgi:hypothetical protein
VTWFSRLPRSRNHQAGGRRFLDDKAVADQERSGSQARRNRVTRATTTARTTENKPFRRFALVTNRPSRLDLLLSHNLAFSINPPHPSSSSSLHLLLSVIMPTEQQPQPQSQQNTAATTKQPSKHSHASSQAQPAPRKVRFNVGPCLFSPTPPFSFVLTRYASQALSIRSSMS